MNVRDPDRKEVSMKKIVIIGANDFQRPLIKKAGEMGYETHVFAWRDGATGAGMRIFFMRSVLRKKSRSLRSAVKYSRMQYQP